MKIVFLVGSRQCGKTTVAKHLLAQEGGAHIDWDVEKHRSSLREQALPEGRVLWVFDELHKQRNWKNWLTGQFDLHRGRHRVFVTARLDSQKLYLCDWARVESDRARFENLPAVHLLRLRDYAGDDVLGEGLQLRHFRDVLGHEVGFVLLRRGKPWVAIEAKIGSAHSVGAGFKYLLERTRLCACPCESVSKSRTTYWLRPSIAPACARGAERRTLNWPIGCITLLFDMETVTISPRFQVVIPRAIRDAMGLVPGEKLRALRCGDRVELVPARLAKEMRGYLKGMSAEVEREEYRR